MTVTSDKRHQINLIIDQTHCLVPFHVKCNPYHRIWYTTVLLLKTRIMRALCTVQNLVQMWSTQTLVKITSMNIKASKLLQSYVWGRNYKWIINGYVSYEFLHPRPSMAVQHTTITIINHFACTHLSNLLIQTSQLSSQSIATPSPI